MCAIPFVMSMERRVVGFVLADMLLNVRGSERYDEEERDGEGDGGDVGGSGRMDASSSASAFMRFERERDQVETPAPDDRRSESSSSSSSSLSLSMTLSTPLLNDISFDNGRCRLGLALTNPFSSTANAPPTDVPVLALFTLTAPLIFPFPFVPGIVFPATVPFGKGGRPVIPVDTRRTRTVPASFRCSQSMIGLLDLRFTFFVGTLVGLGPASLLPALEPLPRGRVGFVLPARS